MAYSKDVISRAQERLAISKARRESQLAQRLTEAYRQVPRLREIDRQLRLSMASAVQAAFSGGQDVQAAIENIKQDNLRLQEERKALVEANFRLGWLDETPICSRCGGVGYMGSTMCDCLKALCLEEQEKELTLLAGSDASFDRFCLEYYADSVDPRWGVNTRTVMAKTFDTCRQYAQNFNYFSGNLLFSGDTGLGKTFLSACIAKEVAAKGFSVAYESAVHLFSNMERARFENDAEAREKVQKYTDCDLLILDDLGTEIVGQFTLTALYTLINDRILSKKATIISTNLTTDGIARRYNPQIASRLRGNFQRLAFIGEDIRLKTGQGKL
ncbi:MAG: DNA replication protein DnaC [Ruminococcaceae bacterium]|nr:DNA replication protein DnaC [Oscillospiraceae bacterium]